MGGGPSAVGVDIATAYDSTVESTITNLNLSWTVHDERLQYTNSTRSQYAVNTRGQ